MYKLYVSYLEEKGRGLPSQVGEAAANAWNVDCQW